MSNFPKFVDFLEAKEKGVVGDDYNGPLATKFANQLKEKDKPETVGVRQAAGDNNVGLGHKASPGLTPTNSIPDGEKPGGKVEFKKMSPKMTTEAFHEATRHLSPAEFIQYLSEDRKNTQIPTISDLYGNEYTPDANQAIHYVAALISANDGLMQRFLREVKRLDALDLVFENALEMPDSYGALVEGMRNADNGKGRCKKLAKAMNDTYITALDAFVVESVGPPRGMADMGSPSQKAPGGAFGGGSGPDASPMHPQQGGPMGGGGMDASPMHPQQGGPMGGGGSELNPGPQAGMGMPGMNAGGAAPDFGQGPVPAPQAPRGRLKEATAHGNLIEAMSEYPVLLDHMKSVMKG